MRKERRPPDEDAAALQRAAKRLLAAAPALATCRPAGEAQPAGMRAGTSVSGPPTQHPTATPRVSSMLLPTPPATGPLLRAPRAVPLTSTATMPRPHSAIPPPRSLMRQHTAVPRPAARPSHPRPPLAPANRQLDLLPSPGWPACSPEHARAASDDASSPRGQALHVLAADVREAVSGGLSGRVSKSLESLLFISSGGCRQVG